jgi:pheromone shutdown protein TraB
MKKVTVIGTGHVFRLRQKVRKLIQDIHPQAVCVELDEGRYEVLLQGRTSFHPLALLQARLADTYHTIPGNDMLGAVEGARDIEAELYFIDRDIEATKGRLGEAFVLEFLNPLEILRKVMLFPIVFLSLPRWGSNLEEVVKEFERDPEKYRRLLGRAFPVFKKVLLDEREEHMAGRIRKVLDRFDQVAVVTGAGHAADLKKLLNDFDVEVIPLTKLLDG